MDCDIENFFQRITKQTNDASNRQVLCELLYRSQSIYSDEYLMHRKTRNSLDVINVVNLKHMVAKKDQKTHGGNLY